MKTTAEKYRRFIWPLTGIICIALAVISWFYVPILINKYKARSMGEQGAAQLAAGRNAEAIESYSQAVRLNADVDSVCMGLSAAFEANHNPKQAKAALWDCAAPLRLRPDAADRVKKLEGLTAELTKRTQEEQEKVVAIARNMLDEWPAPSARVDQALKGLNQLLKESPGHPGALTQRARHTLISRPLEGQGAIDAYKRAEADLLAALNKDPKFVEALVVLGNAQLHMGMQDQSAFYFERAEKLDPALPGLSTGWARLYVWKNEPDLAAKYLARAEQLISTNPLKQKHIQPDILETWTRVYTLKKDLSAADAAWRKAIEFGDDITCLRCNYAEFLLFERGDLDGAIQRAEEALPSASDPRGVKQILGISYLAKWAASKGSSPSAAAGHLSSARQNVDNFADLIAYIGKEVGGSPPIGVLFDALVKQGVPINTRDHNGDTALTLAAYFGKTSSVEWLLKRGADINATDSTERTAVQMAIDERHLETLTVLAKKGANLNQGAPVFKALERGPEYLQVFIDYKANLNARAAGGSTPLIHAASTGRANIVDMLLKASVDTTARTDPPIQYDAAQMAEAFDQKALAAHIREVIGGKKPAT